MSGLLNTGKQRRGDRVRLSGRKQKIGPIFLRSLEAFLPQVTSGHITYSEAADYPQRLMKNTFGNTGYDISTERFAFTRRCFSAARSHRRPSTT